MGDLRQGGDEASKGEQSMQSRPGGVLSKGRRSGGKERPQGNITAKRAACVKGLSRSDQKDKKNISANANAGEKL